MSSPTGGISEGVLRPSTGRAQIVLFAIVLGSLAILLCGKVLTVATRLGKPTEITWPAAANVYIAGRVQHGGPLYGDWRVRPHVPTWYGPALYLPVALLGRLTGAGPHALYMIGRWISLSATLGTAGLIVWWVMRSASGRVLMAVMMAMIFLTGDGILGNFDISFRADAPACFCSLLGLAVLDRARRPAVLYGSILIFLAAFLYKSSCIAGPVSAVLWLWCSGRKREGLRYAVASAVTLAVIVGLLQALTGGRYALNAVEALKGHVSLLSVPYLLHKITLPAIPPLTVATYALCVEWASRKRHLITLAFGLSIVIAAASTCRDGSDTPYYMLSLAVACVICGQYVGEWWGRRRTDAVAAAGVTVVLLLAVVRYVPEAGSRLAHVSTAWNEFLHRDGHHHRASQELKDLTAYLNSLSGPVLCQFNDVLLYCPRSVLVDTYTFSGMADVGVFDDRELIDQIRRRQMSAIVLDPQMPQGYQSTDFFRRQWREAMVGRYQLERRFNGVLLYRPVGSEDGRSRDLDKADS